jgi:hypothetical protein
MNENFMNSSKHFSQIKNSMSKASGIGDSVSKRAMMINGGVND